jgi:diaminohydroxyphosphoribosylaminopyrimidine deaminase/5-amino-6-(5-phosphoribosylamino)uracil reductase
MSVPEARRDEAFMRECLRLAQKGRGFARPNPMVGALVVKNGRVIARGYHRAYGKPHAEAEALEVAGARARGATLYVNLEPCRHFGKTSPCTEAIIRAGISRVMCAARDPNTVARGGVERLRRAGIPVSVGLLTDKARELNEAFYLLHEKRRPFVALKFAVSLDGKLATRTGDSKWITSEPARRYARRLRGMYQAVVVGVETVRADDPHLGARTKGLPDPLRIVLDSTLRIPLRAKVLRDSNVIIAATKRASVQKKALLQRRGIRVLTFADRISPKQLLAALRRMDVISVLVEGGGATLGSFIDAGIADRVYAFYAPILVGGAHATSIGGRGTRNVADALRFKKSSIHRFGDTVLITGTT